MPVDFISNAGSHAHFHFGLQHTWPWATVISQHNFAYIRSQLRALCLVKHDTNRQLFAKASQHGNRQIIFLFVSCQTNIALAISLLKLLSFITQSCIARHSSLETSSVAYH